MINYCTIMGCNAQASLNRCLVCDAGPFCHRLSWPGQHGDTNFFYMNSGPKGKKCRNYLDNFDLKLCGRF